MLPLCEQVDQEGWRQYKKLQEQLEQDRQEMNALTTAFVDHRAQAAADTLVAALALSACVQPHPPAQQGCKEHASALGIGHVIPSLVSVCEGCQSWHVSPLAVMKALKTWHIVSLSVRESCNSSQVRTTHQASSSEWHMCTKEYKKTLKRKGCMAGVGTLYQQTRNPAKRKVCVGLVGYPLQEQCGLPWVAGLDLSSTDTDMINLAPALVVKRLDPPEDLQDQADLQAAPPSFYLCLLADNRCPLHACIHTVVALLWPAPIPACMQSCGSPTAPH